MSLMPPLRRAEVSMTLHTRAARELRL